jgi:hypothetical protein
MSLKSRNTWFRRLGFAAIAALGFGTMAIPTAPADAAVRAFFGPGGVHVAVVQHPHHDWWRHPHGYYGPAYYGHYGYYGHHYGW